MEVHLDERERHEVSVDELGPLLRKMGEQLRADGRVLVEIRSDGIEQDSVDALLSDVSDVTSVVELTSMETKSLVADVHRDARAYSQELLWGCERTCQHWEAYEPTEAGATWGEISRGLGWLITAGSYLATLEERNDSWNAVSDRLRHALQAILIPLEAGRIHECARVARSKLLPAVFELVGWFGSTEYVVRRV